MAELRGGRRLRVVATPLDRALAVGLAFTESAQVEGEAVLLDVPDERTPEVVRALVADGVDVHEAVVTERTLEEVFFEMTRLESPPDDDDGLVDEPGTEVLR